jgi:hypothetical protein
MTLFACESSGGGSSFEAKASVALNICEKLRSPLSTLMGNAGFRALLARALLLASSEIPWLREVQVTPGGSLRLDEVNSQVDPAMIADGGVETLAELLGLLVAFVGEKLTVQIVCEVWPELPRNDHSSVEDSNETQT